MVRKKTKSKRLTTSMREKIKRNARETHRKQRRDARRKALLSNGKKCVRKDPGIPNLFPLKESILIKARQEKERLSQVRKDLGPCKNLSDLISRTELKNLTYKQDADCMNFFPTDSSVKAFYKEFKKVVDVSDVILEVLDCRDPLGCRARNVEKMILSSSLNKRIILVLNKIDLVPRSSIISWLKYLRNELPTVAFRSVSKESKTPGGAFRQSKVFPESAPEKLLKKGDCLGAENLMNLLKNFSRNNSMKKTSIVVGVIGYPNVGKSSVINSLKRIKVCNTGSKPGVTRHLQYIHLDKDIKLVDSPGVLFRKKSSENSIESLLLKNCSSSSTQDPLREATEIISRCKPEFLCKIYNLQHYTDPKEFLILLARQRGRVKKGGIPDIEAAASILISEWNSGEIPFYTVPPTTAEDERYISSEIVETWSKEFNINELLDQDKDLVENLAHDPKAVVIPSSRIPDSRISEDPEPMECTDNEPSVKRTEKKVRFNTEVITFNRKKNKKYQLGESMHEEYNFAELKESPLRD